MQMLLLLLYVIVRFKAVIFFVFTIFQSVLHSDNEDKIAFERHLILTCDAPYVSCPKQMELMHQQRQFTVRVDPTGLEPSVANFTQVP